MRRRYIQYMEEIQPSAAFVSRLEREMNRELRRTRRQKAIPVVLTAAAVLVAIVFWGVIPTRHQPDVISQPQNSAVTTFTPSPTDLPTPEPTASPTVTTSYPPEEERLEIEMGDGEVYGLSSIINDPDAILFAADDLVGVNDSNLVEIHQSRELNSVVVAPLRPGDAYWSVTDADNNWDSVAQLTDEKGSDVGYAERVQYYDAETNTVREGWKHTLYEPASLEASENPVERVQIPAQVRADNTPLRYGKSADAPAITTFEKDQLIAIGYRVGNWLYVSNDPYCVGGESFTGWMHVTEVLGASWKTPLNQVDLLADSVNLRDKPDGKIIGALTKDSRIFYGGATIPGKEGDWHYVSVNWFKEGYQDGYVSAEYAKLNTFRLESKLSMDDVVSATLRRPSGEFYPVEQTVEGEKLGLLLERLRNAYSKSVYSPVCAEGTATITLTYADGSEVELPISGDGCTQVRYGDVTYDLKTDAERAERFLNDGGASQRDILSPIFDQIDFL